MGMNNFYLQTNLKMGKAFKQVALVLNLGFFAYFFPKAVTLIGCACYADWLWVLRILEFSSQVPLPTSRLRN